MAVFLTKNAPGLAHQPGQTRLLGGSPVARRKDPGAARRGPRASRRRGQARRVDAARGAGPPSRRQSCAGCHDRFDALGLAFEGYGPVGELRTTDLGGRPVDTHAQFPGGGEGTGIDGLLTYLKARRQDEFVDNLCRKLLAYALGRTLLASDDELVEDMPPKAGGEWVSVQHAGGGDCDEQAVFE